jgi:hypothetical protein
MSCKEDCHLHAKEKAENDYVVKKMFSKEFLGKEG